MKFTSAYLLTATALLAAGAGFSFASAPTVESNPQHVTTVRTQEGIVQITPVSENIFRVSTFSDVNKTSFNLPYSQAAVLSPDGSSIKVTTTPSEVILASPTTTVNVNRTTGRVKFYDAEGALLLSEAEGVDNSSNLKTISFKGGADEHFFGAGERAHSFKLNGDTLINYNRPTYGYGEGDPRISQMNITVPYIVSDLGYGILFDDYNKSKLIIGDTILYESQTPKPLSYYFINGEEGNIASTTRNYSQLTGLQPLPPFWALGYITSKYGYRSQDETLGVIDTLKQKGYPVDGIILDLYWYGVETDMGRLDWKKENWPNPEEMLAKLKEQGVHLVPIHQPYYNLKGAINNYNELDSLGYLTKDAEGNNNNVQTWVGEAGMLDITNPDAAKWLWNRLKPITSQGLSGWWGDLGEPEVHPESIVHFNKETANEYHNRYGNDWSKLVYEGLRSDFPEMRPMLLMRGGTAGLQRYSVFPWSGDVSRSWAGLRPQVNIMLNSGLSGLGYMSSDLGGFAVDPKAPSDPELYVRWVQMGAFTPTFRTHAQQLAEPYHYPKYEKILLDIVKGRYKWLPYNYTLAYQNASDGLPLVRPLNFRGENSDAKYADIHDEYLWGDNVLVAPVMTKGATSRKVIFPAGQWISWNHPLQKYNGGTTATVKAPLNELPLFVRAGAFIPQYDEPINNVSEYNPQFLTIKYFPAKEWSNFTLFDDNRISPTSLEDGQYQLTTFSGSKQGNEIYIAMESEGSYEGMPEFRMLTFEVVGMDRKPKSVTSDHGTPMPECVSLKAIRQSGWWYDTKNRTLYLRLPYSYERQMLTIK
ncbi:MAG: DUF5110 domain-containing protein [Prevotella sp.]|nr:DUF5110 domain-containing protein [Bacteroides sp.]MCM1367133.1 DUF5110 domain-containing protein [Prevotella sp.]MCM1437563.1 DUF5110 domain-containing protein [Prevotella sp.]